jgi:hypothetical protein
MHDGTGRKEKEKKNVPSTLIPYAYVLKKKKKISPMMGLD